MILVLSVVSLLVVVAGVGWCGRQRLKDSEYQSVTEPFPQAGCSGQDCE
jgi:hypothetical protein